MPKYHLRLQNSTGPSGNIDGRDIADDDAAIREGGIAAAEVLMSEASEGHPHPHVTVTIERDGSVVAAISADIVVQRFT